LDLPTFKTVLDAILNFTGGTLTVYGQNATAGIFATYPKEGIRLGIGFLDQATNSTMKLCLNTYQWSFPLLLDCWDWPFAVQCSCYIRQQEFSCSKTFVTPVSWSISAWNWNLFWVQRRICHKSSKRLWPKVRIILWDCLNWTC